MVSPAPTFEELFRERRDLMLRILARRTGNIQEAEEILQDAFVLYAQASEQNSIANPEGYLMQIALNLTIDRIRQESSRRRRERSWVEAHVMISPGGQASANSPAPDQALTAKDELARLGRLLELLSPQVRTAFILHKVHGLSHGETAKKMRLSKSTVEKHIMKAMKHVLAGMADGGPSS